MPFCLHFTNSITSNVRGAPNTVPRTTDLLPAHHSLAISKPLYPKTFRA